MIALWKNISQLSSTKVIEHQERAVEHANVVRYDPSPEANAKFRINLERSAG